MELLSPAGSLTALYAAIRNGADAVYFGGSHFNARLGAQNFDSDEMISALDYCRIHGVKSYITMNTLTHDRDLQSAVDYAAFLYEHGADALIVQDLGLFSLLKKHIPHFELHASTQMCISSLEGVRECESLGFKRVVLSRELSIADISYIHEHSNMPLEAFVHGAMCMSFSGGCLFSSMVGARSGNCGTCAQPCRKYAAIDRSPSGNDLSLSLSDLCMIENVRDLKRAGVTSFKIEGRMKKPEYIAAVTHAYRRAIDGADDKELRELKQEMFEIFNRGDFTTGYYFGDNAKTDRIATAAPSADTLNRIRERATHYNHHRIDMKLTAYPDTNSKLYVKSSFASFTIDGAKVEVSNKPITDNTIMRYEEQLCKLGGTVFEAGDVSSDICGFLPVSAVNDLRRLAVDKLEGALVLRRESPDIPKNISLATCKDNDVEKKVIARVMNLQQAYAAQNAGADEIVIEYGEFSRADISNLQDVRKKASLNLALPISIISRKAYDALQLDIDVNSFDGIEINNLGQLEYAQQFSHITGGMHLNVFNAHTAKVLLDKGLERITLSPELNMPQVTEVRKFIADKYLNVHMFGRVVLMNLFHCPIKEHIGCKECGGEWHHIIDADGRRFPMIGTHAAQSCIVTRLYNCFAHDVTPRIGELNGISLTLSFTTESASTVKERIEAARAGGTYALPGTTRGYFKR